MLRKEKPQPDVLPGADPQLDCQTTEEQLDVLITEPEPGEGSQDQNHGDAHDHDVSWRNVGGAWEENPDAIANWIPQRAGWTIFLERIALAVERPANRLIGTAQLNPFYHTGTIATLLLIIVALTGFFLFLFFLESFRLRFNLLDHARP